MQHLFRLATCIACAVLLLPNGLAEDAPDSLFFDAYQQFQAGERMENEQRYSDAKEHFERAEKILRSIKQTHSDWQPLVVDYRLGKTIDALKRLQDAPPEPAAPSNSDDDLAGPLPLPDPMGGSLNTPATSPVPEFNPRSSRETPSVASQATRPSQSTNSREAVEMARKLRESDAERKRMERQIQQLVGQYKSAQHALDKKNVDVLELRSSLAQIKEEFSNYKKDNKPYTEGGKEWQEELEALRTDLREAHAEIESLTDERNILIAQLDRAKLYIDQYAQQQEQLTVARDEAIASRDEFRDKAKKYLAEVEEYRTRADRYYAEAESYKIKLESTESLREQIESLGEANADLTQKLKEAEDKVGKMIASGSAQDDAVIELRSEINSVRDQLLAAQVELQQKDSRIAGLQAKLDETTGELAMLKLNPLPRAEEERLSAENELLRGIVMRQIKQQARLEQARRMIQDELERLEIKSASLDQQLVELAGAQFELTDAEKELFKKPVVALVEDETPDVAGMAVAVAKSSAAAAKAEAEAAPTPEESFTPNDPRALPAELSPLVAKAKQQFAEGRFEDAEKTYEEIIKQEPDSYFALSNLAVTQFQMNKLSAAAVALRKAISIYDEDAFAYTILGIVLYQQQDLESARDILMKAIEVDPEDHKAYNYLGITMFEQGDSKEAEEFIQKAIELDPEYADAHFNLAVVYILGKPPAKGLARQHYDKATALGALPDASLEQLLNN